ncbi:MAG: hypothetical protein IK052_07840 [Bacteroidales bacterium]|nr:hypothetical protein [Bacteroidales bacterium]
MGGKRHLIGKKEIKKSASWTLVMAFIRFIRVTTFETDNFSHLCKKGKMIGNDYSKPVNDCFHVYSDGTRLEVLFETEEDCIFGMNLIPIVAFNCNLTVLCLEIMKTHLHTILRGNAMNIQKFKGEIKRQIVKYFSSTGRRDMVENSIWIEADAIKTEEELRRKIIYVFRNCTEAGYPYLPENYRWGPGPVYCQKRPEKKYKIISTLSTRSQARMFRTNAVLPQDWEYDDYGMLVPASYIDLQFINQRVFSSPRQFIAFLNVKKNDLVEMEAADAKKFLVRREEDVIRKEVNNLAKLKYGVPVKKLRQAAKVDIATDIWRSRKTYSVKQLARLCGLNADLLRTILHQPMTSLDDSES